MVLAFMPVWRRRWGADFGWRKSPTSRKGARNGAPGTKTLALLDLLPQVRMAQLSEVRHTIEARRLYSLGIGLTDAHLIASVFLNSPTLLWTRDKRLRKVAEALGIHAGLA